MSYLKRGKVESCSRIKDGNGRLVQGEDEVQRIWKKYFENLYNIDPREQLAVLMCGFDGLRRSNYFEGEPIGRAEVKMRVKELKNRKCTGKYEVREEMIKGGGDRVVDWIWRQCNVAFEWCCA